MMTSEGRRLMAFVLASIVLHVLAVVVVGPQRLGLAPAPPERGHQVSVRLEAATAAPQPDRDPGARAAAPAAPAGEPVAPAPPRKQSAPPERERSEPAAPARAQAEAELRDDATTTARAEPERGGRSEARSPGQAEAGERRASRSATPRPSADEPTGPQPAERSRRVAEPATGDARNNTPARRAEVREAIVAELAQHFRYPRLAQRRGWEGTVVLSVRILPDGRLDRVRVERSSGLRLLDRSARNSLARIGRLPRFAGRVGSDGLALRIPVTYRLESA